MAARRSRGRTGLALLLAVAAGLAAAQSADRDWAVPVDFDALRTEYGARDDYARVCESGNPTRELESRMQASDVVHVIDAADRWLKQCPVDGRVHMLRAYALTLLGRENEADAHRRWAQGLLRSILATGDGKTPETAWRTISIDEEYFLVLITGARPVSQALDPGPPPRDVVVVETPNGSHVRVYFNPEAHFARLERRQGAAPAR